VGGHERPRAEWIEIAVPALVSEEMFALAQEQLEKEQHHSPRRTMEPTLLQRFGANSAATACTAHPRTRPSTR
jgi:site-specific DNA recombinase